MNTKRILFVIGAGVGFAGIGACTSADKSVAMSYAVRQFQDADHAELVQAAVTSMEQVGFRVARHEPDAVRLVSEPLFDVQDDPASRRPPRLSSTGRQRRIADMRVAHPDEQSRVYCRVLVQEQTTQAHRMLSLDQSGDDVPSATPIDREAATTDRQNTVWQTIRRDRITERRILSLVESSLKGAS